ncbi:hypothetical protein KKF86_05115 [bacterium]|nr:hypothetical protein [bacterium]
MRKCKQCSTGFEITDEENRLYKKFGVEPTGLCFDCDQKSRLCFRNERVLYQRKCDLTGRQIVSIYAPDKPYIIYNNEDWYGDSWDALDYGQDFDPNRPLFDQLKELQLKVPRPPLVNVNNENSEYCNMCVDNKNCYLVFGGDYNEDVLYGTLCMKNKNSMDIDLSNNNELCYMMGDTIGSYGCQFAFDSKNCKNCYYVSDCSNCNECILSTNLSNKSYCIENKQYSKEEYFEKKSQMLTGSYQKQQELFRKFKELFDSRIVKYSHQINCQNCTGDYIKNAKNCINCFDTAECEDIRNGILMYGAKDCFNCCFVGHGSELCYSETATIGSTNVMFNYFVFDSSNLLYCDISANSHDCFACVGIHRKQYCILNKQYSKEEYEKLKSQIIEHMKNIGEWGQFLPKDLSCYGYNESTAHIYYPLTKEQALKEGFNWYDTPEQAPESDKVIPAERLPDDIKDIPDDILNWAIKCEKSGRLYKVVPQELKFYRANNIPVPHLHSDERHNFRRSLRNKRVLYDGKCQKCGTNVETSYSPDRPEKVYCEQCYISEVY